MFEHSDMGTARHFGKLIQIIFQFLQQQTAAQYKCDVGSVSVLLRYFTGPGVIFLKYGNRDGIFLHPDSYFFQV